MDNPGNDQSYQNEISNEQTYATRRPKTQLPLPLRVFNKKKQ